MTINLDWKDLRVVISATVTEFGGSDYDSGFDVEDIEILDIKPLDEDDYHAAPSPDDLLNDNSFYDAAEMALIDEYLSHERQSKRGED